MGCDGGTIPTRDELVRTKKKQEKASKEDSLTSKWQHCAISQEPLQPPIVACQLGRLFNKEAIINFLLDRTSGNQQFNYINSMKDIKELNLTVNKEFLDVFEKAGSSQKVSQYVCPITGIEMSGRFKFVYLLSCGCVFSERALRELKDNICTQCLKSYDDDDIITLNSDEKDMDIYMERMKNRKLNSKRKRKTAQTSLDEPSSKLSKSIAAATTNPNSITAATTDDKAVFVDAKSTAKLNSIAVETMETTRKAITTETDCKKTMETTGKWITAGTDSKNTLETTGKVVAMETDGKKTMETKAIAVVTAAASSAGQSNKGKSKMGGESGSSKNGKKSTSLQNDPNASATYKSLFCSHESAKRQAKAHWVTYNPLFY